MRTEAVRTLFIHYLLKVENSWLTKDGSKGNIYFAKPYEAALNHYRMPGHLSGSLYTGKYKK